MQNWLEVVIINIYYKKTRKNYQFFKTIPIQKNSFLYNKYLDNLKFKTETKYIKKINI